MLGILSPSYYLREKKIGKFNLSKTMDLSQGPVHCRKVRMSFCEFNQATGIQFE